MDTFAALADPVRRDLVLRLARGAARVVDLTADHPISRPAISRHLKVLAEAGLVEAEDRGRERHYRLRRDGLTALTDWLAVVEDAVAPPPRFTESVFDGLELEVRRTGRERRAAAGPPAADPAAADPAAAPVPDHPSPPQEDTA